MSFFDNFIQSVISAIVGAASVGAAAVTFAVFMVVMAALHVRVVTKITCKVCLYRVICAAAYTAEKLYSRFGKCCLRSTAYAAADKYVNHIHFKEACKSAVSASHGEKYLLIHDFSVFDIVNDKLFGMTEMLENLSVFIGYCYSHYIRSFRGYIF